LLGTAVASKTEMKNTQEKAEHGKVYNGVFESGFEGKKTE